MDVLPATVLQRELPQEPVPLRAPSGIVGKPCSRRIGVLGLEEAAGDAVELDSAIQLRPACGAPPNLAEGMEDASLDARGRPYRTGCLGEPGGAVCHRHDGRGHAHHEGRPCLGTFALRQMPCDHMLFGARHEHDRVASDPKSVQEHDVEDLTGIGGDGPYAPELRGAPPERAALAGEIGLRALPHEPVEELREALRSVIDPVRQGCAASLASPSGGP